MVSSRKAAWLRQGVTMEIRGKAGSRDVAGIIDRIQPQALTSGNDVLFLAQRIFGVLTPFSLHRNRTKLSLVPRFYG